MSKSRVISLQSIDVLGNPLLASDLIIQYCYQNPSLNQKAEQRLQKLILQTILALLGKEIPENFDELIVSTKEALKRATSINNTNLLVVFLMRLASERSQGAVKWILGKEWCHVVTEVIETNVPDFILSNLDRKAYSYQKLHHFGQIVTTFESSLEQALLTLTSLDRWGAQRHSLLGVVNRKIGQTLMLPLLPDNTIPRIQELYSRVEKYMVHRNELEVIESYSDASTQLAEFVDDFEGYGTLYTQMLVNNIGKRLIEFIEDDFSNNKAVQPADIVIEESGKKYPFHHIEEVIELSFAVRNISSGYAYNISLRPYSDTLIVEAGEGTIINRLGPREIQPINLKAQVFEPAERVVIRIETKWHNFDKENNKKEFEFELYAQSRVDWEQLSKIRPYSLEAIETVEELIGRRETLDRLIGIIDGPNVGSAIIQGQKRVGKTSIAKTLKSYFENNGYWVVYLEGGDYVEPKPEATIARLGTRLSRKIRSLDARLSDIDLPDFEEALGPFTDFLDEVFDIVNDRRLVVVLDEFDQLPVDLYAPGPLGNAFFLTLRSISSRPNLGFVVVGGEKMVYIMRSQGYQLNRWEVIHVDYFTRDADWADYVELVCRPVEGTLEYSVSALEALHSVTAGNPYFTKLVCEKVFQQARLKRDSHITQREINDATQVTIRETDQNTFQHFWDDGIFDVGMKAIEKAIRRQKTLIAVSESLRKETPTTFETIMSHPLVHNLVSLESELKEFVSRKVLIGDVELQSYDFKVALFYHWLLLRGIKELVSNFVDEDILAMERAHEEQLKIHPKEIHELTNRWGSYKTQEITEARVRAWLDQFEGTKSQRYMFTILENLRFYSDGYIREKLHSIDGTVKRKLPQYIKGVRNKRRDILVSYLDGPGKSGSRLARLYVDEASISTENIIELGKIVRTLKQRIDITALVFVDDFVGTGEASSRNLEFIANLLLEIPKNRKIHLFFIAIVAFSEGWKRVQKTVEMLPILIECHVCEILETSAQCFSKDSRVFPDSEIREYAKSVAMSYGARLQKDYPLGYGDLGLAVVFEESCPNNSLPILWSEDEENSWVPLFPR